jgi:tripartite-type tricarboxylate transporter receptor subunit TctC
MKATLSRRTALAALLSPALGAPAARAQAWPARPVRVVIPFAPGGSTDAVTRPVLERLRQRFGPPFVPDNRGGAGSALGTGIVAAAAPDGYTLLCNTASFVTAGALQPHLFNPVHSFEPVAMLARSPFAIIVAMNSPIRTVADLIRMARENPDRTFFATAGAGSSTHFATELFNLRAGIRMQHVPYRGIGPAMIGILSGDAQVIITTPASAAGQIRDGLARIVAYTAPGRPPGLPEAPIVRETVPDYASDVWWGILAPKGTPRDLRGVANEAINAILRESEIVSLYHTLGSMPAPMSPEEFGRVVETDLARAVEVAAAANIKLE